MSDFPAPPPPPKWATEVPGRTPHFKMHQTWGQVRSAIGMYGGWGQGKVRGGKVYEWVNEEWVMLYDIPNGTKKSEHPFFLGTKGGPQDTEKMARRRAAEKTRRIEALKRELAELEKE